MVLIDMAAKLNPDVRVITIDTGRVDDLTVKREGREYRGTIGATRGPRPRFVLLLSLDL